jgi:hypothetical protein
MRRVLVVGLTGLFLLSTASITGCDNRGKADIPDKTIELPKNGPVPAGAPGGGEKDKQKGASAQ